MSTQKRQIARVIDNREIAPATNELVIERGAFTFRAGEEIQVHGADPTQDRTYSLASGETDPVLRILYRVITEGVLTPKLAAIRPDEWIEFTGPFGSFTLRDASRPCWFIATGTGIAPLLSFIRTHASVRPVVLHGVRLPDELYGRAELEPRCSIYRPCVSGGDSPTGRVTNALRDLQTPQDAEYYLCGRNDMISDVRNLLRERGIPSEQIIAEPYFFW